MSKLKTNNVKFVRSIGTTTIPEIVPITFSSATLTYTKNNPTTGPSASTEFGRNHTVSVDGNYTIVGAQSDVDGGKAYIYNVTNGSLVSTLNNPNAFSTSTGDKFGHSVDISGNFAIVSAPYEDDTTPDSGTAYIFDVTSGNLVSTIYNPYPSSSSEPDYFGWSVAIHGQYAIVGANGEDGTGADSGRIFVFYTANGNWTDTSFVRHINNPNAAGTHSSDSFGAAVSLDQNYIAVSAFYEDMNGLSNSGVVYVFDLISGNHLYTLNPTEKGINWYRGYRLKCDNGNVIFSSIISNNQSGMAWIYDMTTGNLLHTLNNPNAYSTPDGDRFGTSVDISGNYAIVGAHHEDDTTGPVPGKAYIFDVTTGQLVITLDNPATYSMTPHDRFGESVSIDGKYVVVSAYSELLPSGYEGILYMYELS